VVTVRDLADDRRADRPGHQHGRDRQVAGDPVARAPEDLLGLVPGVLNRQPGSAAEVGHGGRSRGAGQHGQPGMFARGQVDRLRQSFVGVW
jgi:hypothetical protein